MRISRINRSPLFLLLAFLLLAVVTVAGCSSDSGSDDSSSDDSTASAACPDGDPISISASVDQWGNIAQQLAGDCGQVNTVITSSSIDPHDYEPTSSDIQEMTSAQVAVVNGADYDPWAEKALADSSVTVVDAGTVCDATSEGVNPHLWYDPDCVMKMGTAISDAYEQTDSAAKTYFEDQQKQWQEAMKPYTEAIASAKEVAEGKSFGATESVFDYMASALGMKNDTPQGYQNASKNETDPSPGDIQAFQSALANGDMDVLIFNTQTEGPVPTQLKEAADSAGVPVVDVTETLPDGAKDFQDWQITQINSLTQALQ